MLSVICYKPFCFRIFKDIAVFCIRFKISNKLVCIPFCHFKVVHATVSTILGSGAWHLLCIAYGFECCQYQLIKFPRGAVAFEYEIKTCKTTHRTPVDNLVFPIGCVSKISCNNMFKRMHCPQPTHFA